MPPLDENYNNTELYEMTSFYQYLVSLYYSVLMLAGNDMAPQGYGQIIFATIFLLAASIINANIFGNMAVILQQINRKQSSFHEKVENATITMRNMSIPENLQNRVQAYLIMTQSTLDQQKEFDSFLKLLSPSLRNEVTKHIFQESILWNPIFESRIEILDMILYDLTVMLFLPEDDICRQGVIGNEFFFLARGECEVHVIDENKISRFIHSLKPGSYFGEVALLKEWLRTANVKSRNYSTWASIENSKFMKLIGRYPFIKKAMEKRIKTHYQDRWRKFVKRSLKNVDYLYSGVSDDVVEELSYKMEIISLHLDDYLFTSGRLWQEIFIVCNGELEIKISNKDNSTGTFLDTLYSGWTVGSYSALVSGNYTISAKAMTDCTVLKLDFLELHNMRVKNDDLMVKMDEYEKYISKNGLPYWDYRLHRTKLNEERPIVKFRNGVKRIMRILKSYKSSAFTDILKKIQEQMEEERKNKQMNKIKKALLQPKTHEEKVENWLLTLTEQVKNLTGIVEDMKNKKNWCTWLKTPSDTKPRENDIQKTSKRPSLISDIYSNIASNLVNENSQHCESEHKK